MNQPEPQSVSFPVLMSDIEKGLVKIPQFQRNFVWTKEKSAKLVDSILKGYPIGTLILWKTKEPLRTIRNLGDAELPATPPGDYVQHVLDGQQRLTSLFASVRGLKIQREERVDDFSEIYVDLSATDDQQVAIVDTSEKDPTSIVKVVDLLNADLSFLAAYPERFHGKLSEYKKRLETYAFSVVLVREAPIDVATEIFTRINVTGTPLSVFEIMVAKTFDPQRDFDLAEEYGHLIEALKDVRYDTLPPTVILQTVSAVLTKECSKRRILKLDKSRFINAWPRVVESIHRAVDYFHSYYRIPVSRLLPYSALLVPFSYFFYSHPDKPTGDAQRYLKDFFWRTSLSGRYSYAVESRLAQDIRRIDQILKAQRPKYDYPVDLTAKFVEENGWFSAGRSYVKAILCLLAYHQPKSFIDHSLVLISNDWLKRANSRNYHHFFPKAYLKKQGYENWEINHVANITIVDDFLNKRKIRDKAPATYMKAFAKENPELQRTMKTHLIKMETFGVWENDYQRFFEKRCRAIARELAKRVIPQDIDDRGQQVQTDDYDYSELEEGER